MIIVLKPGSSDADIEDVSRRVRDMGFKTHLSRGDVRTIVGVVGEAVGGQGAGIGLDAHGRPLTAADRDKTHS